jgi:hypothetical protein
MAADNKLLAHVDLVGTRALVEPPRLLRSSGAIAMIKREHRKAS